jgi:hypothetical protein
MLHPYALIYHLDRVRAIEAIVRRALTPASMELRKVRWGHQRSGTCFPGCRVHLFILPYDSESGCKGHGLGQR